MTLIDFVYKFLREMIKCHSSDTILNQIRHLTFIVNTGLCGTEDYITTLISEQRKVMVRLGKPSIKKV